jgi:predicted nucleic acid-binding protein
VGDGDLIIAATAILKDLPLVTSNTRHFDWIAGLQLIDWRKA